jgi:DNA-binding GntR family transcriptional regulator
MIKKETLRESVRDYLRDAIIQRKIKPQERLIETRIAKELGVSQAPVREAIRELEMIGFIDTIAYSGSYVHSFTKQEIRDNYKIRALLEIYAIKEAIKNLDAEEMQKIEQAFMELKQSYRLHDAKKNTESDIEFHHEIIRATRIKMLERAWHMLNMSQWTFLTTSSGKYPINQFEQMHEDLFYSIRDRDVEKACRLCQEHYDLAADIAVQWIDEA